jgi:hypothetical protein
MPAKTPTTKLPTIQPPTKPDVEPMRKRVFYCDDPTWDAAMARAAADGVPLAKVLRHYLRGYAAGAPKK